jgi:hypothetical protein
MVVVVVSVADGVMLEDSDEDSLDDNDILGEKDSDIDRVRVLEDVLEIVPDSDTVAVGVIVGDPDGYCVWETLSEVLSDTETLTDTEILTGNEILMLLEGKTDANTVVTESDGDGNGDEVVELEVTNGKTLIFTWALEFEFIPSLS